MAETLLVLVTGATGKQGGSLAKALLKRGHRVRALTRRPGSPQAEELSRLGAEIVLANFDDRETLNDAAKGADAVFCMSTPFEEGVEAEVRQAASVADAAESAGVKHFVYTSVAGADRGTGIPHFESKFNAEQRIRAMGLPFTIIAPVFFMENYLSPWWLPGLQDGALAMAMPPRRSLQHIAVENIGRFAALVLERRAEFLGKRIELASDELTGEEAAATLSRTTGREIRYVDVPIVKVRAGNEDFARMFEWFNREGYSVDIASLTKAYPEVAWSPFEEWCRRQDWSVLKQPATR